MSITVVKSARVARGAYNADTITPVLIRPLADVRTRELEEKILQLEAGLQQAIMTAAKDAEVKAGHALEKGREQGIAESREPVAEAAAAVARLMQEVQEKRAEVWDQSRDLLMKLSIAIARRIVGDVAQRYEPLAVELAGRCIKMVRDQARVVIAINSEDAAKLRAAQTDLKSLGEGVKHLEIVERQSVPRGGVVIETDMGQLDARLDEQFKAIEAALLPKWSQSPEGID